MKSQENDSTEVEASGYTEFGGEIVASIAQWSRNGRLVECATYVSDGPKWSQWSSGGAEFVRPVSQEDVLGGIGVVVGQFGDIAEFEDRYLIGVAGWAMRGVEVSLNVEGAEVFNATFADAEVNYYSVPIVGESVNGDVPDVDARFS